MPDDEDSTSQPAQGQSFWRGLRTFLFGEESEATLREEIEEAIESHEGEVMGTLGKITTLADFPDDVELVRRLQEAQ